ncbi:hypothetical protein HDU78_008088 [Chytriomyces hyalinus]|nr:hypothetical protein HDU78_008088 [Chytriomyces hyalinus]
MKAYVDMDSRVRPFVTMIKYWAKQRALNDAAKGGTLSSYCWVIMAINFLQTRSPPVLPSLQQIYLEKLAASLPSSTPASSASSPTTEGPQGSTPPQSLSLTPVKTIIEGVDCSFEQDTEPLKLLCARNKSSLAHLVVSFFHFFGYEFQYTRSVLSLRHGAILTKRSKMWDTDISRLCRYLCVEEPFTTDRNLANSADEIAVLGLRGEFRRAAEILCDGEGCQEGMLRFATACEVFVVDQTEGVVTNGHWGSNSWSESPRQPMQRQNQSYTQQQRSGGGGSNGRQKFANGDGKYGNNGSWANGGAGRGRYSGAALDISSATTGRWNNGNAQPVTSPIASAPVSGGLGMMMPGVMQPMTLPMMGYPSAPVVSPVMTSGGMAPDDAIGTQERGAVPRQGIPSPSGQYPQFVGSPALGYYSFQPLPLAAATSDDEDGTSLEVESCTMNTVSVNASTIPAVAAPGVVNGETSSSGSADESSTLSDTVEVVDASEQEETLVSSSKSSEGTRDKDVKNATMPNKISRSLPQQQHQQQMQQQHSLQMAPSHYWWPTVSNGMVPGYVQLVPFYPSIPAQASAPQFNMKPRSSSDEDGVSAATSPTPTTAPPMGQPMYQAYAFWPPGYISPQHIHPGSGMWPTSGPSSMYRPDAKDGKVATPKNGTRPYRMHSFHATIDKQQQQQQQQQHQYQRNNQFQQSQGNGSKEVKRRSSWATPANWEDSWQYHQRGPRQPMHTLPPRPQLSSTARESNSEEGAAANLPPAKALEESIVKERTEGQKIQHQNDSAGSLITQQSSGDLKQLEPFEEMKLTVTHSHTGRKPLPLSGSEQTIEAPDYIDS